MPKATDRQTRAIRFLKQKFPETAVPLIEAHGGIIENLTLEQARSIMDELRRVHPPEKDRNGGEPRRDERRSGFRPGSKQDILARALRMNRMDVDAAYATLLPSVGRGPLSFSKKQDGRHVPLPMEAQRNALMRELKRVKKVLQANRIGGSGQDQEEESRESLLRREAARLLEWIRTLREFCRERAADGHKLDEIGLRPVEYGARMLMAGIPLPAIKHALTMHYPPEVRERLNVYEYDVTTFRMDQRRDGVHAALPYCLAIVEQRIPLALIGPKGTGKTTLAMQIAEIMSLPFAAVSMTNGTSPSAFNGRPKIGSDGTAEYVMALLAQGRNDEAMIVAQEKQNAGDIAVSQFERIYGGGGVFLFDEMDAGNENLLLIVNAAIANGWFFNTATGRRIEMHPDFIAISGMNTLGLGAGRDYNARTKLDAATLDRWNAGRVRIELDERIETSLFWNIIDA
jgi:hypothetical protein